jgi:hypothetical protein
MASVGDRFAWVPGPRKTHKNRLDRLRALVLLHREDGWRMSEDTLDPSWSDGYTECVPGPRGSAPS